MQIIQLTSQGVSWQLRGTSEGVESFSLPKGLFEGVAKGHSHGRYCPTYVSERWRQKSTLLVIWSDTPAQLQSDECVRRIFPLTSTLIILDITKFSSNNCLIFYPPSKKGKYCLKQLEHSFGWSLMFAACVWNLQHNCDPSGSIRSNILPKRTALSPFSYIEGKFIVYQL